MCIYRNAATAGYLQRTRKGLFGRNRSNAVSLIKYKFCDKIFSAPIILQLSLTYNKLLMWCLISTTKSVTT